MKIKLLVWIVGLMVLSSFASALTATGGTIYFNGTHNIHTFLSNGTFVITGSGNVTVLVVAGGGGGSMGGGGAGGLNYTENFPVTGSITVTIGTGGKGVGTGSGVNGTDSVFGTIRTMGGGGGAFSGADGSNGGSGGGGGGVGSGTKNGGTGITGQGNNGGTTGGFNGAPFPSGGGGGAGAVGQNGQANNIAGNGGMGINYTINGSIVCYAGGGGGSFVTTAASTAGTAICGGGSGIANRIGLAVNGTANTGGGGGGYVNGDAANIAGYGGSGIVIVSYIPSTNNINISSTLPTASSFFSINPINFNVTVSSAFAFNVTLYLNSTANETKLYSAGVNITANFSKTINDGNWTYYFLLKQQNDSTLNTSSAINNIYVDTTLPTITANFSSGVYVKSGTNFSMLFSFADNFMLWGWNVSMNNRLLNYTTNVQVATASVNIINSSWVQGANIVQVDVYDAHTDENIDDFKIEEKGDAIRFDNTELTSLTPLDDISYTRQKDRYNLTFETSKAMNYLEVQIPDDCYYQDRDDLFPGWFVCPDEMKWIDFANDDSDEVSVEDNLVTVYSKVPKTTFSFNSIGSLNHIQQNYTVYDYAWIDNCTNASVNSLNLTFIDEINGTLINWTNADITATFTTWAGNASFNQSFSLVATGRNIYNICIYPNVATLNSSISIYYGSGTQYPQRRYANTNFVLTNSTQVINLYMLPSTNGIYARFRTLDQYSNIIPRTIASDDIETTNTDGGGLAIFWVNPDTDYTFSFSKVGYTSVSTTLRPVGTDIYNIVMSTQGTSQNISFQTGITYSFNPVDSVLNNGTLYNFTFTFNSSYFNIQNCYFELRDSTNTLLSSSSTSYTSSWCLINIPFNTSSYSQINVNAIVNINGTNNTYSNQYSILETYDSDLTFNTFFNDINNFASSGFNNFTRAIIVFITIFIIVVLTNKYTGLTNPEVILWLIWACVLLFSYFNWLYMPLALPSGYLGLNQYIIFYLITLGVGGYTITRHF